MPLSPDMIERAAKCAYERNRDGTLEWSALPEHKRYEWRAKVTPVLTAALGDTHVMGSVEAERERCAKIADDARDEAERQASELTYGELYGAQCSADTARDIAAKIRGSQE